MDASLCRTDETFEDLRCRGMMILQKRTGFRFGLDAVLLADFARADRRAAVADLGTGSGVLMLLMHGRGYGSSYVGIELDRETADMASRSVSLNGLDGRMRVICGDVRDAPDLLDKNSLDMVVCNPPYRRGGSAPGDPRRALAESVPEGGLLPWYRAAYTVLKGRGVFCTVGLPEDLADTLALLRRAALEPKQARFVYHRADAPASLVLIRARKNAKPGLNIDPPLILYTADGRETAELRKNYHHGEEAAACST